MSKTLTVNYNDKPCYDIVIEPDFNGLVTAFEHLNVTGKKICIVTDSNVGPIYAREVADMLE